MANNYDWKAITELLRAAGAEVFQDRRSDAQSRAADCLEGKTHFFSEGTRRFHGRACCPAN